MSLVGPLKDRDGLYGHRRFRCKAYRCRFCGPRKLREVRNAIAIEAGRLGLKRFVTLTLDPSKIPPGQDSIAYLRNCWRKMRESLRRYLGKPVEFIAVVELHKSGIAHLHVLVGSYLPQNWLSIAWESVGGGQIVYIKWVDVHRVSGYLAKYFTKESLHNVPSGTRRFSCSHGIVIWQKKPSSGWWVCVHSIDELRAMAETVYREMWEVDDSLGGMEVLEMFISQFFMEAALAAFNPRQKRASLHREVQYGS